MMTMITIIVISLVILISADTNLIKDWSFEDANISTGKSTYWRQIVYGDKGTSENGFICSQEYVDWQRKTYGTVHNCSGLETKTPGPKTGKWFVWFPPGIGCVTQDFAIEPHSLAYLTFYLQIIDNSVSDLTSKCSTLYIYIDGPDDKAPLLWKTITEADALDYTNYTLVNGTIRGDASNYQMVFLYYTNDQCDINYFIDDVTINGSWPVATETINIRCPACQPEPVLLVLVLAGLLIFLAALAYFMYKRHENWFMLMCRRSGYTPI